MTIISRRSERAVHRLPGKVYFSPTCDAGYVDDGPVFGSSILHCLGEDLIDKESAFEVDVQDFVKVFLGHFEHVAVSSDPGTIDDHVWGAAVLGHDLRKKIS